MNISEYEQKKNKARHMVSDIVRHHWDCIFKKQIKNDFDYIKNFFKYVVDNNLESEIDYLTLTIDEFRLVKDDYYNILKKCKVSILMQNINDISLQEIVELKRKFNIHYISIIDLGLLDRDTHMLSIDLVYKYKKAIGKIVNGIDDNYLAGVSDREKRIFGIIIPRIIERTRYDLNSQENYEKNSKETKFGKPTYDNPSNEMIGLIKGRCVCRGDAGILRDVLGAVNIEVQVILGITEDGMGHAWIQVKLDGVWYNVDITWDRDRIINEGKSYWLLKSDEVFERGYLVHNEKGIIEWSHRKFNINRTPGHECNVSLAEEDLAKYFDFSNLRKKNWLGEVLGKVKISKMNETVKKMFSDLTTDKNKGK